MSHKFANRQAQYFKALVQHRIEPTPLHLANYVSAQVNSMVSEGVIDPEKASALMDYQAQELTPVLSFFNKMKPVKPTMYAVNGWGYDQVNYENVILIGQVGASMVLVGDYDVYSVSKKKFTTKAPYTNLDSVRSTSWEPAYSTSDIAKQQFENAYFGH